jgi:Carboxypeptidase regulatory-like domain
VKISWILLALGFAFPMPARPVRGQDNPPQPTAPANPNQSSGKKYSHANDFLLRGTVFTNTAYAFPGVQIRVRRAGEKKFRWETYSNSRGEFAIRIPQGSDYELNVHSKGFVDQNRTINAKAGNLEEGITFQMQPVQSKQTGGKT